ncbi:MAG: radical SAM protein, partial [Microgenomates group bacterium]
MYKNVFLFESTEPGVFLIYSPLRMTLFATNSNGVEAFQRIQQNQGTPNDDPLRSLLSTNEATTIELAEDVFDTADLTICPTFRCQLRCEYCFSMGGVRQKSIDIVTAKKAVDFAINRNRTQKQATSKLTWHGGGEPTLAWTILKEVSAYHQREASLVGMEPILSIVSNGVWSETVTKWIIQHMNKISISCDGPADIQDSQRPLAGRYGSSTFVFKTLRRLKAEGAD